MSEGTDALLEAAWMTRVASGAVDVVELCAVAKKTLGAAFGRREGEVHALVYALVRAGRLVPAGRSPSGATRYAAAGAAHSSSEPGLEVPPPASKAASKKALAVASGVRDPEDRGRVVSDVLAHLAAIAASPGSRSLGSTSRTRALLHRVDRGRRTICVASTWGEAAKRFAIHEGPGLLVALIVFVSVWIFVMEPRVVPSRSMQPTLMPGDRIVVWKPSGGEEPPRWSIITFRRADEVVLVKRVVGLPGESIEIDNDGDAIVNGERLVKPDDVREAVREPLVRSEFTSGRLPEGWEEASASGEKWVRYTRNLRADKPHEEGEPYLLPPEPLIHDVYVDTLVAPGIEVSAGIRLSWKARGGSTAGSEVVSVDLRLESDGWPTVVAASSDGWESRVARAYERVGVGEVNLSLAYVDGWVHARSGSESWRLPLLAPPGPVAVSVLGDVKTVAIDRDVHYTHPVGARYATENAFAIPAGHVFCLGDHPYNSTDSRFEKPGPVPVERILGRVVFRIWPPWRVGPIH